MFCDINNDKLILQNELAYCVLDKYPVTPGYSLLIPKRYFADYFEITQIELEAVQDSSCIHMKYIKLCKFEDIAKTDWKWAILLII